MTARPLAPNPGARDEGHRVRESWADELRPRRSEIREVLLGQRPVTEVVQGIYKVTFDRPCYILLEFDYLTSSRSTGDIHSELTILVNPDTGDGHYQKTKLNLLADRSVSGLASSLEKRLPALKIPWQRYLNDAVQWVIHEYRSGEPGIPLTEIPEPEGGSKSLLPPILAADGATILFGDGGAGKSSLALAIAASLHSGLDVIPGLQPAGKRNVLYLDWEWSGYVHRKRLESLWATIDGPMPGIIYVPCRLSLKDERDRIRRIIRDHDAGYAIIDSVGLAAGGSPNEDQVVIDFFAALRQLGIDSTLIAHIGKMDAKGTPDKPYGNSYWHHMARATWYVKGSDEESADGTLTTGLYNRKANEGQRVAQPIGLRWHFRDDQTWVERIQVTSEPSLASQLSTPKRIFLLLKAGPLTIHEIADEVGAEADTVRKALQRGESFVKLPGGGGEPDRWGLAARE